MRMNLHSILSYLVCLKTWVCPLAFSEVFVAILVMYVQCKLIFNNFGYVCGKNFVPIVLSKIQCQWSRIKQFPSHVMRDQYYCHLRNSHLDSALGKSIIELSWISIWMSGRKTKRLWLFGFFSSYTDDLKKKPS
jgi:hypothetical protein